MISIALILLDFVEFLRYVKPILYKVLQKLDQNRFCITAAVKYKQ